jgi:hypothetical protein
MKFLKTISVVTLAFLVLVSSSSFIVGIHRCAGEIQNMALLSKAEGCDMQKNLSPCNKHVAAPCCEDETILHQGEGFKASVSDIAISESPTLDLELPHVILSEVIPSVPFLQPEYYNYYPPLRSYDLTVSHRVFLI